MTVGLTQANSAVVTQRLARFYSPYDVGRLSLSVDLTLWLCVNCGTLGTGSKLILKTVSKNREKSKNLSVSICVTISICVTPTHSRHTVLTLTKIRSDDFFLGVPGQKIVWLRRKP